MKRGRALQIIAVARVDFTRTQAILKGLQILSKYDEVLECNFEHDQMWASGFDMTVEKMTKEEVAEMALLGWFEDTYSWSHH